MHLTGNTIFITGGATGIGRGLSQRFLEEGNTVIVCGRSADKLAEAKTALPGLVTYVCDLTQRPEREQLVQQVIRDYPGLNVLINNAGIQQWVQPGADDFFERVQAEMAINMEVPVHLTHLFMEHQKLTAILNVTSGLAFSPLAKVPVYSASKAFLHSFTLSLRYLLKDRGVEVIELIPPALNTDLGGKGLHDFAPPVAGFIESVFLQLKEGRESVTFGFSEQMLKADPEQLKQAFGRMNP